MPTGSKLSYEARLLGSMTAAQVLESKNRLLVSCAPCQIARQFHETDVAALAAYRPGRPLRDLKFKCSRCGAASRLSADGTEGG